MHPTLALCFCLFAASATAQEPPLAVRHVAVVDVAAGAHRDGQTVLIRDGRIAWVGPATEAQLPEGCRILDGSGRYLIPGLWDMHVHLQFDWDADVSLPMFLAHGVTGVRDMASDCKGPEPGRPCIEGLLRWREEIENGERIGPRLVMLSSFPLSIDRQVGGDPGRVLDRFQERGVEFVKILQNLSPGRFAALMAAAQERGLPVGGHVPLAVGMVGVSEAGLASIEHARDVLFEGWEGAAAWRARTRTQNPPTEILRRMVDEHDPEFLVEVFTVLAENGTRYVPTHGTRRFDASVFDANYRDDPRQRYVPAFRFDRWDQDAERTALRDPSPEAREALMDFFLLGLEATRQAHDLGVEVLAGTDANDSFMFPGASLVDELELMVAGGLTPAQALRTATLAPADFIGRGEDYGSIAVGKVADLLVLGADPLADIAAVRALDAVVFGGVLHQREDLDRMLEGVAARVRVMNAEVELGEDDLVALVGRYQTERGVVEVLRRREHLRVRLPDQPSLRLRARARDQLVHIPRGLFIDFERDEGGAEVVSVTLRQGEQSMATGTRLR